MTAPSWMNEAVAFLGDNGLGLAGIARLESIPPEIFNRERLDLEEAASFRTLILIANIGGRIWDRIEKAGPDPEHPIDTFTRAVVARFIERFLPNERTVPIFPSKSRILPVQRLGEWFGWVHPSPIGVGIHAEYGLWHAYRQALVTTALLDETDRTIRPSPCDSCEGKPCVAVCPPGAVKDSTHRMETFDVESCAEYRLAQPTLCRDRCLARLACPVGREHRYPPGMMHHAYLRSLPKMKAYLERIHGRSWNPPRDPPIARE